MALTVGGDDFAEFEGSKVRAFRFGQDLQDASGVIYAWMKKHDVSWVILRPDQFVYAVGSGADQLHIAATQFRRHLGRSAKIPMKPSTVES